MQRCYEIFESGEALDDRRAAVELLRVVADRRALAWIPELLADEDAEIQAWGAGVLDQMIWSELIDADEAEDLLQRSATMTGTLTETQHGSSSKALLTSTANARRGRSGTRWVTFAGSRARPERRARHLVWASVSKCPLGRQAVATSARTPRRAV